MESKRESDTEDGEVDGIKLDGSNADRQGGAPAQSRGKAADEKYCSSCGEAIKKEAEVCPECGVRQEEKSASSTEEKNPGIAALASFFFTGAGQIYNGQVGKGIGLLGLQFVNVMLMFLLIGFITFPIVWIYGVYDAHKTAKKINNGEL